MTAYAIPPFRIDPRTLPPQIRTSELGSFAHNTLAVRLPQYVPEIIGWNSFTPEVVHALLELRTELTGGQIRGLAEDAPDKHFWDEVSRDHIGRSWLDVPWYWAETFFYRRVLEATRYFQPGPMYLIDPYRAAKLTELVPEVAPHAAEAALRSLPADVSERFKVLLYSSLWGNRLDLSYKVALEAGREARLEHEQKNLLVDDSERVRNSLQSRPRRRLALVADNAGTELMMDLVLVDFLLENGLAEEISLHLKEHPFFISDAMPADVEAGLEALARGGPEAQALAGRVRTHRKLGRLNLYTHWFYSTPLFYFQLPDDLHREFAEMDFVIIKGDVNYRRLLGDAHWDPTTSFDRATAYFPAPLVALRTLKAELIVGLSPGESERLSQIDPGWMVNGRRGLVQARF